jgi:hypothetical protein
MEEQQEHEVPPEDERILCCSKTTTKASAKFNLKMMVIIIVLLYSMGMLFYTELSGDACNSLIPFYSGLIGSILGLFVKQPTRE